MSLRRLRAHPRVISLRVPRPRRPGAAPRTARVYSAAIAFICSLASVMICVEIVVGVVGALQHLQPRTLRRVDLLEERQRVGRAADGERLGDVLHQRLGLEVLVVHHVAARGQVQELGVALDLHFVREQELHEVDGVVDALAALRDDHEVAADERGDLSRAPRPAAARCRSSCPGSGP